MERPPSDNKPMQTHRPVAVANPYLRNNRTTPSASASASAASATSSCTTTAIPPAYKRTDGKVAGSVISTAPAGVLRAATITPKPIRSGSHSNSNNNNNPYQRQKGTGSKNLAVTPTPKKQHTNTAASASLKSSVKEIGANLAHRQAPISGNPVPPSAHLQRAPPPTPTHGTPTPTPPAPTMNVKVTASVVPKKKQSTTLKSQLKSQIAQLHRQKRQFIEQKEAEKQRLLKEQENERLRIQREKELKRLAAIKEQERRKIESEKQRQNVGHCINDMVKIIERRMEIEHKYRGTHYAIGESMEYIVKSIESKEKMRLKAKREQQLRAKEVRVCLGSMILAVEQRMQFQASNATSIPTMGELMQQQYQPQQPQSMMTNYSFFQHQVIPSYGMHHPSMMAQQPTTMMHHTMIQGGYNHPHAMQSFPHLSHHHPQDMSLPASSISLPHNNMPQYAGNPMPSHTPRPQQHPVKATLPSLLHTSPDTDPYSPYVKSHHVLPTEIVLVKATAGESFGVTLRYECKSALVPIDENTAMTMKTTESGNLTSLAVDGESLTSNSTTLTEKKQRRKRVNYGVMAVADASKAKFVASALEPGDIILAINGKPTGGLSFTDACRVIGTTSTFCPSSGGIQCVLKVARMNVVKQFVPQMTTSVPSGASPMETQSMIPIAPTVSTIPFYAIEGKVISGEFTTNEWTALIRGLSEIPFRIFKGMALLSVTQKETLASIFKIDEYGKSLQRRSREALKAKLAFESRRISLDMQKRAAEHWALAWEVEQQQDTLENDNKSQLEGPLTDAQRSALREASRPAKGCKCGSSTHEFVSDPSCLLYRDVRQYCEANSIYYHGDDNMHAQKKSTAMNSIKTKNSMEKAYIDRFVRLREADAADQKEAEFVLEMEKVQASRMKKAVFVPPSLCTLVLSAVASVMDKLGDKETIDDGHDQAGHNQRTSVKDQPVQSNPDDFEDSDDDEGVPLISLVQIGLKRSSTNANSLPPSKRPKKSNHSTIAPCPYFTAEILKYLSATHGHLFQGKTSLSIQCSSSASCSSVNNYPQFLTSFCYLSRTVSCYLCLVSYFQSRYAVNSPLSFSHHHRNTFSHYPTKGNNVIDPT